MVLSVNRSTEGKINQKIFVTFFINDQSYLDIRYFRFVHNSPRPFCHDLGYNTQTNHDLAQVNKLNWTIMSFSILIHKSVEN